MKGFNPQECLERIREQWLQREDTGMAVEKAIERSERVEIDEGGWPEFQRLVVTVVQTFFESISSSRQMGFAEAWAIGEQALSKHYPSSEENGTGEACLDFVADCQRYKKTIISALLTGLRQEFDEHTCRALLDSNLSQLDWEDKLMMSSILKEQYFSKNEIPLSQLSSIQLALILDEVVRIALEF